eukprot:6199239-Pleurochrysis_carterae.AAC.3
MPIRCLTKLKKLLRTAVKASSGEGGREETKTINSEQTEVEKNARNSGMNTLEIERPERERGRKKEYKEFTTQSATQARPPQAEYDDTLSSIMRWRGGCEQVQDLKSQLVE